MKALQQTNSTANEVVNTMRSHHSSHSESVLPNWLTDIYKKSGISSVIVKVK